MVGGALLHIFVSVRGGYLVYFVCIVGWAVYRQLEVQGDDDPSEEPSKPDPESQE
jgi:hypothetical protein